MMPRTVIDGNAFYEIDEECMARKKREGDCRKKEEKRRRSTGNGRRPENAGNENSWHSETGDV